MQNFLLAAFTVLLVVWLTIRWLNRFYDFSAGIRLNLGLLTKELDRLGAKYSAGVQIDGASTVDEPTSDGGGVAVLQRRTHEVVWAQIKMPQQVGLNVLDKSVNIIGCTGGRPAIRLSLSPRHCWGFRDPDLSYLSHDPKLPELEYAKYDILPRDLKSMELPHQVIAVASRYLAAEVNEPTMRAHAVNPCEIISGPFLHEIRERCYDDADLA